MTTVRSLLWLVSANKSLRTFPANQTTQAHLAAKAAGTRAVLVETRKVLFKDSQGRIAEGRHYQAVQN